MKFLVVFVVLLAAIATTYLYVQEPTGKVIVIEQPDDFRVFTQAVCEDNSTGKFCRDKIFFSCNNEIKIAEGDSIECGNKSIDIGGVNLGSLQINKE